MAISASIFSRKAAGVCGSTPPTVSIVSLAPLNLRAVLRRGLTAAVRANEPTQAKISPRRGTRVIAGSTRRIGTTAARIPLRLSPRTIASLRRQKMVRLKLRVVATDDDGNRTTLRRTILLR